MSFARARYERIGQLGCEFAKFGAIGVAGLFIPAPSTICFSFT